MPSGRRCRRRHHGFANVSLADSPVLGAQVDKRQHLGRGYGTTERPTSPSFWRARWFANRAPCLLLQAPPTGPLRTALAPARPTFGVVVRRHASPRSGSRTSWPDGPLTTPDLTDAERADVANHHRFGDLDAW